MNPSKSKQIVPAAAAGGLLLVGLLLLLNRASPIARADSDVLFVSPAGSGSDCSRSAPCRLQVALSQSISGGTLFLSGGTYTGTGGAVITLTKSIALHGGWDGALTGPFVRDPETYITTLDGQGRRRVVTISGSASPTLDGLRLTNGSTTDQGGGLHTALGSKTTLNECHIYSNTAGTHGGGAYFRGDATLTGNSIYSNTAGGNGGGVILVHNADTTLTGNQIHDNSAYWGGGVQTYVSNATLANNDIYSNTAEVSGGGANINEADGNQVTLVINRVYSNAAKYGGGVIVGNCSVTMSGNLVTDNRAEQGGGAWFASSDGVLVNNIVVENQATSGNGAAGLFVAGSDVRMVHTTIARNTGGRVGGVLVTNFAAETSTVGMTNTILVSHTVGILVDSGHSAAAEATLWGDGPWSNGTDWSGVGTITTGTVNIRGNPAFLAADAGDYHILPGSAAVGVGVDAGVTDDIDDDPRPAPVGTSPDIGADEISQRSVHLPVIIRSQRP
jgi:parallel beta-helix repeat protein